MEDFIIKQLEQLFGSTTNRIQEVIDIVNTSPETYEGGAIWNIVTEIFGIMLPVGLALASTFFVLDFLHKAIYLKFNKWEAIITALIKLTIIKVLIENTMNIMKLVLGVVTDIASSLNVSQSNVLANLTKEDLDYFRLELDDLSIIEQLSYYSSMLPWIFIIRIVDVIIFLIVFGRLIEICLYTAVAPIAFSTFMNDSFNVGKRFLQSYMAVCLQGIIIIIIFIMYAALAKTNMFGIENANNPWDIIKYMTIATLVLGLMIGKSGHMAKQIIGG